MATTVIKSYNSDNQAEVTDNHELKVTGTFTANNSSVGPTGDPVPADATLVGGEDPSGNLQALQVNNAGELRVAGISVFTTQNVRVLYSEVSSIAVGIETLVNTYTAPPGVISYLLTIEASGENRAQYNIYYDGVLLDKKYSNVTVLTAPFSYMTGSGTVPGMVIGTGKTVDIKVINAGTSTANYSGRFLILEATV